MSDTIKIPFDAIPLGGGTAGVSAVADPPRASFSRSVPDMSVGLLPPTRKPVGVTLPEPMPPLPPAPVDSPDPNPMASTPPPKAGSVRSFLWDLVRPTRTKWAVLAGGVSLVAGAYGLNLFIPTPAATPKKVLPETAKLDAPAPKVVPERQPAPSVGEERTVVGVIPVKHTELAPAPLPLPDPNKPIIPVARGQAPDPLPLPIKSEPLPTPTFGDTPKAAPLPPVVPPAAEDKTIKPDPLPLPSPWPPVKEEKPAPLPLPVMPGETKKENESLPKPAPGPFAEVPDPSKKTDTVPLPVPLIDPKTIPVPEVKPIPLPTPEVPVTPVGEVKPLPSPGLPPVGEVVGKPKDEGPKPIVIDPKTPVVPTLDPKKADPAPLFIEGSPPPVTPVGGSVKEPPSATSVPTPKKGFEVDVVRVRATDTYASISEAYYQSRKYAAALRAFNGDADIGRLQEVEVPPLHELQKVPGGRLREVEPAGDGRPVRGPVIDPPAEGDPVDWGPAGKRRPVIEYDKLTTWKEGMTARDVARAVYDGDDAQWPKLIGPRGAKLRADDPLPKGTEVTFPKEKTVWR
jgi:hypothetical protein